VAAPPGIPFGGDEHMLAESGEMTTTQWTAIGRGLAVRRASHTPPWRGRQPGHRSIVAPLAATLIVGVAATAVLRMGVSAAIAERERRANRARHARERQFCLLPDERAVEGLRRITLGQLDLAIELLSAHNGTVPTPEAVHETRKALKRLRTLVRLLEDELGDEVAQREHALLRDAGRRLASARDAEVMVMTLDDLARRRGGKLARRAAVRRLRLSLEQERDEAIASLLGDHLVRSQVLLDLRGARARIDGWSPANEREDIRAVEPALRRLYRRGRRRYRRASNGNGDRAAAMHAWRKSVKDLRYAAEALRRGQPASDVRSGGALARRADRLGELLGAEHDLVVLAQRVRAESDDFPAGSRRALLKAIDRRRKRMRRRALRDGASLYGPRPRKLVRRVRRAYAREAPT
jgi:CHAD domain-containing protein